MPISTWFAGRAAVRTFFADRALPDREQHLVLTRANGCAAAATYVGDAHEGFRAHELQVLEIRRGMITHIYAFLDTELLTLFDLPLLHHATE